jgi:DNA-binding transcriptional LysR family regulator
MSIDLASVNLNRLVVFASVVEVGSFTGAARRLGMTKATVSLHMQRLEAELGTSLLVRTTRKLALTEAGEAFYEAVRPALQTTEEAVNAVGMDGAELRGTLRMTAPVDYSASVVMPVAAQLALQHPLLKIEILSGDRLFDLVAEGIDIAIRLGKLADSNYQAVRLADLARILVATPQTMKRMPRFTRPEHLRDFPFIALSVLPQSQSWTFEGPKGIKQTVQFRSQLTANTAHVVRAAVLAGAGIAILPEYAVADDVRAGRLLRVLPKWSVPSGGVHAVFPAARYRPQKVRVLVEALRAHLTQ